MAINGLRIKTLHFENTYFFSHLFTEQQMQFLTTVKRFPGFRKISWVSKDFLGFEKFAGFRKMSCDFHIWRKLHLLFGELNDSKSMCFQNLLLIERKFI